ncbi:unnamed protein product [Cyprideis torosa]|uniref:Uncharacterized protein n=1 Tax=Cyprideis torosa TaxID=163714 RepID=A0A7R8W8D6_9CRUS|nr:unnamed protein product [Cyprideis torosa]CAG0883667.1 unnamed protein product [Cyprideis torosa]
MSKLERHSLVVRLRRSPRVSTSSTDHGRPRASSLRPPESELKDNPVFRRQMTRDSSEDLGLPRSPENSPAGLLGGFKVAGFFVGSPDMEPKIFLSAHCEYRCDGRSTEHLTSAAALFRGLGLKPSSY